MTESREGSLSQHPPASMQMIFAASATMLTSADLHGLLRYNYRTIWPQKLHSCRDSCRGRRACHCGEVSVRVQGGPRSVSYCHCSTCRQLSGSPFSCQALFDAGQVCAMLAGQY